MENSLKGKVVLVIGGSSGMGLAIAIKAAARDAQVHIVGRSADKLAAAVAAIGGDVLSHSADIGNEANVKALAHCITRVDHIVMTAADLVFKPFVQTTDEEIRSTFAAKFWGPIYVTRHFAALLSKGGSITFFGGSAAYKASAGGSIVAAVNASLDGLARTLAVELAPIRVNVVSPGIVETPAWGFLPEASRQEVLTAIGAGFPVGRVGKVEELADAALFVMGNGFTTGTVLQIDGGANA
jgi:NAD(P)-dependent dehydrogenase (short-subunit alcohol dehydrogenase family)